MLDCRRTIAKPYSGTDTDSTPPRMDIGGLRKYSHGVFNLVHQHWPEEVESAGGFNVHNTEAAESFHKQCMVLPCVRVRHYSTRNHTFNAMHKFLQQHLLFTSLKSDMDERDKLSRRVDPPLTSAHTFVVSTGKPLLHVVDGSHVPVTMGPRPESVDTQSRILHRHVRVGRVELFDLMCTELQLPKTTRSYTRLGRLTWGFHQKLRMSDGNVYWSTDTDYPFASHSRRRDSFVMKDVESVQVRLSNGDVVQRNTAMCCQAICFVTVRNLLGEFGRGNIRGIGGDSYTFVLVRWFQAHPDATQRNDSFMPLCPPPFNINHALWQYAEARSFRSLIFDSFSRRPTKHWQDQCCMFGETRDDQIRRWQDERRAYYGLIRPCKIQSLAYMSEEFELNTTRESSTWIQTINM